jgi:methyltransferase
VSVFLYLVLLALVALSRLAELAISARNQRRLVARGARKIPERHFHWMVLLHTGVLVSAAAEVAFLRRPLIPALALAMGLAFALANGLRWWTIATLAEHWNVQVMDSSRLGIVTTGPFRWIRHPNYASVLVELVALPMIHTAWLTAAWAAPSNLCVLRRRIAVEEKILLANPQYREMMANKPRFLPKLFERGPAATAPGKARLRAEARRRRSGSSA